VRSDACVAIGLHTSLNPAPSQRSRDDEENGAKVRASFIGSVPINGARRVWRVVLAKGFGCRLHRIEQLMRAQVLHTGPRRGKKVHEIFDISGFSET
jgi:putative transposase